MKKSEQNLKVINNFILFFTQVSHSSDGEDPKFEEPRTYTGKQIYDLAKIYIEEDHVDGKENEEDHVVTYGAESSFQTDDREEAFPEQVSIVADFGEEVGTCTAVTIDSTDVQGIQALLDFIEKPEFP